MLPLAFLAAVLIGPVPQSARAGVSDLLAPQTGSAAVSVHADALVMRERTARFDPEALAPGIDLVRVGVFDDRVLVVRFLRREPTADGFVWVGDVVGAEEGRATFAVARGHLSGSLRAGHALFRVQARSAADCIVQEIDPRRFPECTPPVEPEGLPRAPAVPQVPAGTSGLAAAGPTIDVLVVYTPAARAAEGGTAAIEALIDVAVAETNQAYADSQVAQRLRLVARAELTGYVETSSFSTELGRLTLPSDGWLDWVHPLRDACGADVVCMIVENSFSCGVANAMTTTSPPAFAPYAFAVTSRACAVGNYTFAHELGHVMGLTHDRDNATRKCSRASFGQGFTQANAASGSPAVSLHGNLVAFTSDATNLVAGDTNGIADVFLRDRGSLQTQRVSVSSTGVQADGPPIGAPVMTSGRFVVFASAASNLAPGDTNGVSDIFFRDLLGPITIRVSPGPGGVQADGPSWDPGLSATEVWITFTSAAPNLGASAAAPQVFAYDRTVGTVVLASAAPGGGPSNAASGGSRASNDGRYVAFWSAASDLVPGDTNGAVDVFVRDVVSGTTERVSVSAAGSQIAGPCDTGVTISPDGRFVVFVTASADVVAGDGNGAADVFVRDRVLGATLLASASLSGAPGNGASSPGSVPAISNDGRYLAFASFASDLVPGDTNGSIDVFARDLFAGTTERISLTSSGAQVAGGGGIGPRVALSGDGSVFAFASVAALEPDDTNGLVDVYAFNRDEPYPVGLTTYAYGYRTPDAQWRTIMAYAPGTRLAIFSNPAVTHLGQPLGVAVPSPFAAEAWRVLNETGPQVEGFRGALTAAFCFGDGSGAPCPCGNASATADEAGCTNSLGLAGRLRALGGASLSSDTLVLGGAGMPDNSALYFQGTTRVAGGAGAAFGDGLRCAGGAVQRLGVRANVAGSSALPSLGSPPVSVLGAVASPGVLHYQVWYRNAAAFCTSATFNLTNGLTVSWQP